MDTGMKEYLHAMGVTLIGLTGERHQGKSTMADLLVDRYGFAKAHAFDGGKIATEAYFRHITGSLSIAGRMVHGDLKDKPSEWLPGGASPRYFMERFGQFMGVQMGTEWTLEMEVKRLVGMGAKKIVVESLVYEDESFKGMGGKIIRLSRGGGYVPPKVPSDEVQAKIKEDFFIRAETLSELRLHFGTLMFQGFSLIADFPEAA